MPVAYLIQEGLVITTERMSHSMLKTVMAQALDSSIPKHFGCDYIASPGNPGEVIPILARSPAFFVAGLQQPLQSMEDSRYA